MLFWISYTVWFLFEIWAFSRDRRAVAGRRQDGQSLFVVIGLVLLAVATLLLIWGGMAFRFSAIRTLRCFFRVTVTVQDEHRLVTHGPYRLLRHPAYSGAILTICGVGLFMNNWLSLLGAIACALIPYGIRIRVEERALAGRFGDIFAQQRAPQLGRHSFHLVKLPAKL